MTEENTTPEQPELIEPVTEAPAATIAPATVTSVTKPLNEEFFLDADFAPIAAGLGLEIDQVEFSIEQGENSKTLTGKPKA